VFSLGVVLKGMFHVPVSKIPCRPCWFPMLEILRWIDGCSPRYSVLYQTFHQTCLSEWRATPFRWCSFSVNWFHLQMVQP